MKKQTSPPIGTTFILRKQSPKPDVRITLRTPGKVSPVGAADASKTTARSARKWGQASSVPCSATADQDTPLPVMSESTKQALRAAGFDPDFRLFKITGRSAPHTGGVARTNDSEEGGRLRSTASKFFKPIAGVRRKDAGQALAVAGQGSISDPWAELLKICSNRSRQAAAAARVRQILGDTPAVEQDSGPVEPIDIPEDHSDDWWNDAFPLVAYQRKPPGAKEMLVLIAYDICEPRRLKKVATVCEEYGTRVQYSLFECHLKESELAMMWDRLMELIDPDEDRIVAYRLDGRSARRTLTAGTMICSSRVICYLV